LEGEGVAEAALEGEGVAEAASEGEGVMEGEGTHETDTLTVTELPPVPKGSPSSRLRVSQMTLMRSELTQ